MKVLIAGGRPTVVRAAIRVLVLRGHRVRLLSPHAREEAALWPNEVEGIDARVTEVGALARALADCDAAIVIEPSELAQSARRRSIASRVRAAVESAGVTRLVYVAPLSARRGTDLERATAVREEQEILRAPGAAVLRASHAYGPDDRAVARLLELVRLMPAVPERVGDAAIIQPIWAEDLGAIAAEALERDDLVGHALEVAGPEQTSLDDLVARLATITGKPRVGGLGALLRSALRLGGMVPVRSLSTVLRGAIDPPEENALGLFSITPTPLEAGLRALARELPEQHPDEGVGSLVRRHVFAEIEGARTAPEELFERFRARFSEVTPWHLGVAPEPDDSRSPRRGETLTMRLPLRGNVQVRAEEQTPLSVTLVTLEGHPLAGAVRFRVEPRGSDRLVFHVEVHERPSNPIDWLAMATVGSLLQLATWRQTVQHVIEESGGQAPRGIQIRTEKLHGARAAQVEAWVRDLTSAERRARHLQMVAPEPS